MVVVIRTFLEQRGDYFFCDHQHNSNCGGDLRFSD